MPNSLLIATLFQAMDQFVGGSRGLHAMTLYRVSSRRNAKGSLTVKLFYLMRKERESAFFWSRLAAGRIPGSLAVEVYGFGFPVPVTHPSFLLLPLSR